jgi:uncharacterized 2Fe-2S/4Fe-4S cluster protein (DUF4445 family)
MEAHIIFEPSGRKGLVAEGSYLFDAARRLGVEIETECGRKGECDSCAVKITEGASQLCPPTKAEKEHLTDQRRIKGERLSCQAKIERSGEIVVMVNEKKKVEEPTKEEKEVKDFHKKFADLPLEKKVANLLELEAVTLAETFSFVLNSPYKIVEKVMDVMAEFGLKRDQVEKEAKRPSEHKPEAKENGKSEAAKPKVAKKKAAPRKKAAKPAEPKADNPATET